MKKLNKLAPIVLFVYNRVNHTRKTIKALRENQLADESYLYIYSDAPKTENEKDSVDLVRKYIHTITGFKEIIIIKREKNWGLADSIIDGVSSVVNKFGKVIVLEDDLITSPNFLKFMNDSLSLYEKEHKVYSITGYSHINNSYDIKKSYFLKLTSSWSWATWSDRWNKFRRDDKDLEEIIKSSNSQKRLFNFDDSLDYINMARLQLNKTINSWAIYWYLSVFKQNGLTLYPQKKLVKNIGLDGSGIHCLYSSHEDYLENFEHKFTDDIEESKNNRVIISNLLRKNEETFILRALNLVKRKMSNKQKGKLFKYLSKLKLFFYKKEIGKNSYIDKSAHVLGWESISIGENCIVGEDSWLNVNHKLHNFKSIEIEDNCYIGKRVTISSAKKIIIKSYSLIADDCKLLGANHNYDNPLEPYAMTGASDTEIISIGVNVWIGNSACLIGNIKIGHGSVIGAGSVVTKDVPPFCIAVGNPCKVIKRFNFDEMEWVSVKDEKNIHPSEIFPEETYLARLKSKKLDISAYKFASSKSFGDLI